VHAGWKPQLLIEGFLIKSFHQERGLDEHHFANISWAFGCKARGLRAKLNVGDLDSPPDINL